MDEQHRQDYLKLVERFWDCGSDQELNEVFNTHRELVDPDFLQTLTEMALDMEARGYRDESTWRLLDSLTEAMGVKTAAPPITTEANAQLIVEILQCIEANWDKAEPVYALLRANQTQLNDDLLAELPRVAASLLAGAKNEIQKGRAAVLVEFGNLMGHFPLMQRGINTELAIAAYEAVLEVMTREAMPMDWARVQMNLALTYRKRIRGDQTTNLEQGIAAFELALEVMTREAMPVDWAGIQRQLAITYAERIRGDRAANLEQAIATHKSVQEVMTREAMPVDWARAQMNLANAYIERIQGDRATNLEWAIAAHESVLEIMTREAMPVDWAIAQSNLAHAYLERIRGDHAANQEQAIDALKSALEIITREAMPWEWARVQMNLAVAYRQRIQGDHAANLEQAIAAFEAVLEVRTRETMPVKWARAQTNLADAYGERIRGDQAANLEKAIAAYEAVLEVMTRKAMPRDWARVQSHLAVAYRGRIRGDQAANLEQAIASFELALEVMTREAIPLGWATTQAALAIAYRERIRGDRATNLEQAIATFELALEVMTREAIPLGWAQVQVDLAKAYTDRIRGDRATNLEQAIAACEAALKVMPREALPLGWARAQEVLAIAYFFRIRGDREANLEQAIAAYEVALEVKTREATPVAWALTRMGLAIAYATRVRGDRKANLEQAIAIYESVLDVMTREAMPMDWATAQINLANAYSNRTVGDRSANIETAIEGYKQALTVKTQVVMPLDWATTQTNLARTYRTAERWQDAYNTSAETISGIESLRSEVKSGDDAKQKLAEQWHHFYQNMVTTCLHLGNFPEAVTYAERSKARNLVDLLANRVEPQNLPPETLVEFHRLKKAIKTEELRLQSEEITRLRPIAPDQAETYTTRPIPNRTQLNHLIQQLEHLIETDIQPHDPNFALTQTVDPLTYPQIQALLPNPQTALIEWYIQNDRVLTFVATQHSPTPTVITINTEGLNQLIAWTNRYLTNYSSASTQWQTDLGTELSNLAEILQIDDVLATEDLAGFHSLIFIPHRYLHLLPLHALPLATHPSLLDRFPSGIRYAPCCQLLHLTQQPTQPNLTHLLAIQNPTQDLPFTDVEVAAIRPLFDPQVKVLSKHEAHKAAVTTYPLQPGHVLHFACHGQFNWQDPLQAGLLLAASPPASTPSKDDQETDTTTDSPQDAASSEGDSEANSTEEQKSPHLTLGNLFSRDIDLTHCRLVTLSACETGQVDFRPTSDEYIGLPSGFLFAGSPSVVSSLWRVSDISTSFLMVQFYQQLKAGQPVPIALNQAQIWLRQVTKAELEIWVIQLSLSPARRLYLKALLHQKNNDFRPFESPYHWAAFCAVGS